MIAQGVASFALHALWQVPLLGLAAWVAVRLGRPPARLAHRIWVVTLLLCVVAPIAATAIGYRAAEQRAQAAAGSISFVALDGLDALPALQREPVWLRFLHAHISRAHGVKPLMFVLPDFAARAVAIAYALWLAFAAARLILSIRRSRQMVRAATEVVPKEIVSRVAALAASAGCVAPPVALSDEVVGPVLAGVLRPTLLLPPDVMANLSAAEVGAVLAHEVAHLRRGDPLAHAAYSWLALPLHFHPAAHWIGTRIRQTREMACDAEAAQSMGSAAVYANALLRVAEHTLAVQGVSHLRAADGHALGMFDFHARSWAAARDGRLKLANGPATADLQLLGAEGAMEERMLSIVEGNYSRTRAQMWLRGTAAVVVAATGIAAACTLQVQPALAAASKAKAAPTP